MSSEHSSEFECDEKQLLVHQSSGTTVINVDHGLATYTAASSATANTTGRTGGMPSNSMPQIRYGGGPGCSVSSSMESCSLSRSVSGGGGGQRGSFSNNGSQVPAPFMTGPMGPNDPPTVLSISPSSGNVSGIPLTDEDIRRIRFDKLVQRAQHIDISSFVSSTNNCMYVAGNDNQGRPVLVFIGKWFRSAEFDTEKAVMYLIKLLHQLVTSGQDYVVIYFHARTASENVPSYSWIKEVYTTLGYEYKKRLKAFYIVHPTVWTKMTCWYLSTFMAPAIKKKIHNVHALRELNTIGLGQDMDASESLSIPVFIAEHDMTINGLRYYRP